MSLLLDRGSSENTAANRWEQSLVRVAFLPAAIIAVLCVVAVLTTLLTAGSPLTGLFGAIGAVWLAAHQVPAFIGGTDLGALPLLPTLLIFAGVGRCAYRFTAPDASPSWQARIIGAAVGGPLAVTAVALAVIADASATFALSGPGPLISLAGVAAVHAVAATVGVGLKTMRVNAVRWGVPTWMLTSLRAGVIGAFAFFAAGALVVTIGAFVGWTEIAELIGAEPTVVGQLGLLVLSILYLPNIMVAGSAVLSGSAAHIGDASYALFLVEHGPVPAVPALGVLPAGEAGGWWPLLLIAPAGIGLWIGWRYRAVGETAIDTLRFYVAAGAVGAMITMALGFLGGGQMGSFGHIGVDAPIFGLYVFGWITVLGLVTAFAGNALGRRRGAPKYEPAHMPDGAVDAVDYPDDGLDYQDVAGEGAAGEDAAAEGPAAEDLAGEEPAEEPAPES